MIRLTLTFIPVLIVTLASITPVGAQAIGPPPGDLSPKAGEHPLAPLIRWGKAGAAALEKLDDYSCALVKRERVANKVTPYQRMTAKVRHAPFSVYAAFVHNKERPWQEVIYVDGHNSGKMYVHSDEFRMMGTVSLFPDSDRAMRDNRYPITEVGILKLIQRLVEHAESDARFDDCEVKIYKDAKVENRPCLYLRVTHKNPRPEFTFHMARIFIDNELNVPVRYEAYTWPSKAGGQPELLEEYTYVDFQFNKQLNDRDFDINNPAYYFPPDYGDPAVDFADVKAVAELPDGPAPAAGSPPLAGAIAMAQESLTKLEGVKDYSCLLTHRAKGSDTPQYENQLLKVRQSPLAMYAFFLGPKTPKGQEAILSGNQALLHTVGGRGQGGMTRKVPADSSDLTGALGAPLNSLGLQAQLKRWIAVYQRELPLKDATVKYYPQIEVDHRLANCVEVTHGAQRSQAPYYQSRLYYDAETKLPVRFEAYGFPAVAGQAAPLIEEFTYRNVELDQGLTDQDFDASNPNYTFGSQTAKVPTTGR